MKKFDPKSLSVFDLLQHFSTVLDELKRRGVIRTRNNPVGDYAEWLCKTKLQLTLVGSSNKGYDAKDKYYRYEIKARREKNGSGFSILSVIRDLKTKNFHYLIAVQFHKDFSVYRAYKISYKAVVKHATWIESVHGWRVVLNNKLLKDRGVTEITKILK
jgi:hypothetical protein